MNTKKYPTAQSVLYETCRIILLNCKNQLADFTAFSAIYTLLFINAIVAGIDTAENMPGEEERALEHKKLRRALAVQAKSCRKSWGGLKRYITKAFEEDAWEDNWNAAGWGDYEAAGNDDWDKVIAMMKAGSIYIAAHAAELTAMPPNYEADFNAAMEAIRLKFTAFTQAETNAKKATDAKVGANNDVYTQVIAVCEDGKHIYSDDEVNAELFSFEAMSKLVHRTGPAGLNGKAVYEIDGKPAVGVSVEEEMRDLVVTVNEQGEFDFGNNLASGKAKLIFKKGDQVLKTEEIDIPAGVTVKEDVELPTAP